MAKNRKIGIVLNNYDVISESFIQTFIAHFKDERVFLFAKYSSEIKRNKNWSYNTYLNRFPNHSFFLNFVLILIKSIFYYRRFFALYRKGCTFKQLITDAGIWTTSSLDYLHFPFATQIIGREYYASVIGAKNSISFRGSDVNVYPVFHNMGYEPYWQFVNKVHCNSSDLHKKLISEHNLPIDKEIEIIYPALSDEYQNDITALTEIINNRNFEKEHFITIGRLHWVKDYPLIFQALGKLKKEGIPFEYTVIGNGREQEHLVFLAKELEIEKNINWVGAVNSMDIITYLKKSTLYLQSSYAEGFSNSCLEAQSQGLQCVVTNVSGMRVCIQKDVGGVIVSDRDYNSFADAIKSLINQSVENRRINGFKTAIEVTKLFTRENQKKQWLNFFTN